MLLFFCLKEDKQQKYNKDKYVHRCKCAGTQTGRRTDRLCGAAAAGGQPAPANQQAIESAAKRARVEEARRLIQPVHSSLAPCKTSIDWC